MMPAFNGLQALKEVKEFNPEIPFILCTGSINEETAVECIKAGADDYIIKEHLTRLPFAVKEALEQHSMRIEKKASALLLEENEEKLQSIFSAAPVGIGLVVNRVFMEVNDTFCKMTGYTRKELIGRNAEIIYATNEEYVIVGIEKYRQIAEKGIGSVETRFKCKDGKILNIFLSSVPLNKDDMTKGVTFTAMDITEIKQAEEAQRESEEHYRILFNESLDGICLADAETGLIIDCNQALSSLVGRERVELIGQSQKILHPPRNSDATFSPEFEQHLTDKEGKTLETQIVTRTGIIREVEIKANFVNIRGRKMLLGIFRDVTVRKKAEEKLRESEEKYRRIYENVIDVFYETSIEGTILEVSPSIQILSGGQYHRDELIGKSMYDFYSDSNERAALILQLKERGSVSDFEITLRNRDGSRILCSISTKISLDAQRRPEKLIGSIRDITDRKNASDALSLAKEKAEASDKLKTTFLNNISHEVRTPLNGILGFAEIMSQTDLSEEEKRVSLSMLFESSDRLLNTITNYMDISLITSGTMSLYKKDFLPGQVLREKLAKYKILCSIKNLDISLKIPKKGEELSIRSDPEILRKILAHLLNNAIKFTEKGTIDFGYKIHRNEIEFFVKDTGIGIDKESLESIFKHFIKEDRGALKITEGSGLGLSISKGLVELLDGKIRVESEKGKGSCFFFTVPAGKEFEDHNISPPVSKQKRNKTTNSILVAEDDETNFFYLKALLKQNTSAEIIHASNGKEAIEKFLQNPDIGLILMDIKMPVMDGLEATRQIKAVNKDVPVIAITAYAIAGDEARILDAGCDCYLTKPLNKKLLFEKIAEFTSI
jgi:PAS domain S-box-containing protein